MKRWKINDKWAAGITLTTIFIIVFGLGLVGVIILINS